MIFLILIICLLDIVLKSTGRKKLLITHLCEFADVKKAGAYVVFERTFGKRERRETAPRRKKERRPSLPFPCVAFPPFSRLLHFPETTQVQAKVIFFEFDKRNFGPQTYPSKEITFIVFGSGR